MLNAGPSTKATLGRRLFRHVFANAFAAPAFNEACIEGLVLKKRDATICQDLRVTMSKKLEGLEASYQMDVQDVLDKLNGSHEHNEMTTSEESSS